MGDAHDLFRYTSGRWIYNEPLRLAERELVFDVPQLKRIAAKSINRSESDVLSIRKLAEGGFNRTFEISMRDGFQVIARLPYPSTTPTHYTIASEVATMDFVRSHGLPVPRVFDYSATNENPVGAEYIIMEKVVGKELGNIWYTMSEKERLKMIVQVVKLEALLFSVQLPASGSIYYKHDLADETRNIDIKVDGPFGKFCIGPDAHYRWWHKERASLSVERGPFSSTRDVLRAVAKRELAWTKKYARPRFPFEPLYREIYNNQKVDPADHIKNLSDYLQIADFLAPKAGSNLNRPTIRHPDLQPNNIFVSDSLEIVGLIDWQHCSVLPLFLQAGPPRYFQNYGDEESENLVTPQLPQNFTQLNEKEQEAALDLFRRRQLHYYYFAMTAKFNKEHFDACTDEQVVLKQKLFQHAGSPWEGDNISLKADLIRATRRWREIASMGDVKCYSCPLNYSSEEVEKCLKLEAEQREADEDMERSRSYLGVTVDGWVSTERYDNSKELNERLKAEAIASAESEDIRAQIEKNWPFNDRDEDE
ncbi:hypothetical protein VTN96DRAFT_7615 [Rasamsonia emersonii]